MGTVKRKAMVSLTYDGTLLCHAETVLPQLQAHGLLGTFYADPVPLLDGLPVWREAARQGHEVGNGCLMGAIAGGSVLAAWTPEMVADDIDETDALIREVIPGQQAFSLGYPWVEGRDSDLEVVKRIVRDRHSVCRSGVSGLNATGNPDMGYLRCVPMDDCTAEHMIDLIRTAVRSDSWIVLSFEGVGSGDRSVDATDHNELCRWLSSNAELAETQTVIGAASLLTDKAKPKLTLL